MNKTTEAQALMFAQSTSKLIMSLKIVELMLKTDPQNEDGQAWRLTRAWIITELERRFPAASDAVEAAFEAQDAALERGEDVPDVDYVAVLLAHIA
jgi:hypothetical protein